MRPTVWILVGCLWLAPSLCAVADEPTEGSDGYVPKELAPSLADQALAALQAKKHAEAITLYRAWLKADPRDASSWYNLACLLALEGKPEEALTALETSVDAGFEDFSHARKDPDLESVRERKRFRAALARGEAKQAAEALPGMQRHQLKTETVGTYIVLLPPDYAAGTKTYPVVFILHGSGSTEERHARVAAKLGREGVIYVAPRALHPHTRVFLNAGQPGWTAWPPERLADSAGAPDAMRLYVEWITRCLDDVGRRYRIDKQRVFAWGHSQGAAAAATLGAMHPERFAGVFAYAGYYPELITDERLAAMKAAGISVELCHGRQDPVVAPGPTQLMGARLQEAGVDHAVHMIDADHRITEDVHRLSKAWMKTRVHGTPTAAK